MPMQAAWYESNGAARDVLSRVATHTRAQRRASARQVVLQRRQPIGR